MNKNVLRYKVPPDQINCNYVKAVSLKSKNEIIEDNSFKRNLNLYSVQYSTLFIRGRMFVKLFFKLSVNA